MLLKHDYGIEWCGRSGGGGSHVDLREIGGGKGGGVPLPLPWLTVSNPVGLVLTTEVVKPPSQGMWCLLGCWAANC